jgi:hypothetical protein
MTIAKKGTNEPRKRVGVREYYNTIWKLNRKILLHCDYCKKAFARYPSYVKGTVHYCSKDCHKAAQKLPKSEQEQT